MKIILKILITAGALLLSEKIITGISVDTFGTALIVALILGVINITIRPIILLITFPINLLSLGLFTFIINGVLLWLITYVVPGFSVDGFIPAILGALIISLFKWLGDKIVSED